MPELRATGAGWTLPQAVANLGLSGLSLEMTREHLETAEMRQKCHREASHVEASNHKCPSTVGRARAVRPKRPLQRGCWGMSLREMGMDGDGHGCECGTRPVRTPQGFPQAWFMSEVPIPGRVRCAGLCSTSLLPQGSGCWSSLRVEHWDPGPRTDRRNHACLGSRVTTCREALPEMDEAAPCHQKRPSCTVGAEGYLVIFSPVDTDGLSM